MSTPIGDLPLVSRDDETAIVRSALFAARQGIGSAVLIVGDPGIGKSRMAAESLRIAREMGFRCAWGTGWPERGVPRLWPWQAVLDQLGHPSDSAAAGTSGVWFESDQERFARFRAIADSIREVAATEPLLIVIEDAHSADLGALLLTRFLIRALRSCALTVVITARDSPDVDPAVRSSLRDLGMDATVLRLAPLSVEQLRDLMEQVGRSVPLATLVQIHDLTGGNPLYVGELLATDQTAGVDAGVGVDAVRSILQLRVRDLSPEALELLAAAAVLGPSADREEVLFVAGIDDDAGSDLIWAAQRVGVLAESDVGRCQFTHELLGSALLAEREPSEIALLHTRAALVLERGQSSGSVDPTAARARHLVAAALIVSDTASAELAGAACRAAARVAMSGLAFETASQFLNHAIELLERQGSDVPTELLIELAQAGLAAGHLLVARGWFRRAADQADEPVTFAEAALGLGGIWVDEHRGSIEHAAYMSLLDTALAGLGDERPDLTAGLRMRRAAERIYAREGGFREVFDAVRSARDTDDPLVLAAALSLLHHTMLGPANTDHRLPIADELVRVAVTAGDAVLALMGVMWRAIDLFLAGDPRAERALNEARERADALQVAAVLFVLDTIDVMLLLRDGHIDEAESAARRCFEVGVSIGDADAIGYMGAHLLTIRWLQHRPHEILALARQVAASPTLVDGDVAPRAAAAVLAAMTGQFDDARADLQIVMVRAHDGVETSSNWMITMFCAAEAAALLDDVKTAEAVYSALTPFRHLPIMGSLGVVCLGSVERSLGVAAGTLGDVNAAVHHFERALEHNHRLGNRVMAAISEGDLGCALIARAMPEDISFGAARVDAAVSALIEFGLADRADALRSSAAGRLLAAPPPDGEAWLSGATWTLRYGAHIVRVPDSIAVRRLLSLLERPGADVAAQDLSAGVEQSLRYDLSDQMALRTYRERIEGLRCDIDQADGDHDIGRASRLRDELDELLDHLEPSLGLRGRSRAFSSSTERARVAVRQSLGRLFDIIGSQDPVFATQLRASIHTGVICRFDPVEHFPLVWVRLISD